MTRGLIVLTGGKSEIGLPGAGGSPGLDTTVSHGCGDQTKLRSCWEASRELYDERERISG